MNDDGQNEVLGHCLDCGKAITRHQMQYQIDRIVHYGFRKEKLREAIKTLLPRCKICLVAIATARGWKERPRRYMPGDRESAQELRRRAEGD